MIMHKPFNLVWFPFLRAVVLLLALTACSAAAWAEDCTSGPAEIAAANAASLTAMPLDLFGRAETGWAFYEPLVANQIGTDCAAETGGFARALAIWQAAHGLPATGLITVTVLERMKVLWQQKRSFAVASKHGCPDAPSEQALEHALPSESYGGKVILLRPDALAAYRAMASEARAERIVPPHSPLLTIFSAYRSPEYDAARCAAQNNCQGVVRASCSAHRTGEAMDINLGAASGFGPDSSDDANRLFISKSPAYRWLVQNGGRFGLVSYAFEPWHWEFVGTASAR